MDPEVLRRARGKAKTKVSCVYGIVRRGLIRTKDDDIVKFFLEDINRADVKEEYFTVRKSFNDIQIIHDHYIYYRLPLENLYEEANVLNKKYD